MLSEGSSSSGEPYFVHFGSSGRRLGRKQYDMDRVKHELFALPDGGQLLIGYHDVYLLDRNAKVRRTIQRRPDRNWLEHPERAAVASDGSFAIITGRNYGKAPWQAHLYSPSGDPIRTLEMPVECKSLFFTYTSKYLVIASESEIYLLTNTGEPHLKFSVDADDLDAGHWSCFVNKAGRELWIASMQSKLVKRFELP